MNRLADLKSNQTDRVIGSVSGMMGLTRERTLPFSDPVKFLSEFFQNYDNITKTVHAIGWVTPEIAMAVERADFELKEIIPKNNIDELYESFNSETKENINIIYLSNPNRLTGSSFNLKQLMSVIETVTDSVVIIDEYYYEFHGITAIPLLDVYKNVMILRSLSGTTGIAQTDLGLALADEYLLEPFKLLNQPSAESKMRRNLSLDYLDRDQLNSRLKEIHNESLKIAKELSRLKVQVRITPTDRLLIKVKSTKDVGNFLIRNGISVDNLHGYDMLNNILSFRIKDVYYNDLLVDCFKRMPEDHYLIENDHGFTQTLTRRHQSESFENFRLTKKVLSKVTIGETV